MNEKNNYLQNTDTSVDIIAPVPAPKPLDKVKEQPPRKRSKEMEER